MSTYFTISRQAIKTYLRFNIVSGKILWEKNYKLYKWGGVKRNKKLVKCKTIIAKKETLIYIQRNQTLYHKGFRLYIK